jgi:uncharacterized membrane protein
LELADKILAQVLDSLYFIHSFICLFHLFICFPDEEETQMAFMSHFAHQLKYYGGVVCVMGPILCLLHFCACQDHIIIL